MTWGWDASLLSIAVVALILGIWLTKRGFRPRRRGDTPHCAACDYSLVGLEPLNCPECGADLYTVDGTVRGERHRNPRTGLTGVALLLAFAGCTTAWVVRATADLAWYQIRPFAWVLKDLGGPPEIAKQAVDEIDRRHAMGELKPGQDAALIERLLKEQTSPAEPRNAQLPAMMRMLGAAYDRGQLSGAQREQFIKTALVARLVVIPSEYDEPPEIRLVSDGVGPGYEATIERRSRFTKVSWDGVPQQLLPRCDLSVPLGVAAHQTFEVPRLKPGKHALAVSVETTVEAPGHKGAPYTRMDSYETTFEIPPPPPAVKWVKLPFPSMMKLSVVPGRFTGVDVGNDISLSGSVTVTKPSANLAYVAYAVLENASYPLGAVRVPAGASGTIELRTNLPRDRMMPFTVRLYLYRSGRVAREGKPPFTEACEDALLYEGVRVEVGQSASSATAPVAK